LNDDPKMTFSLFLDGWLRHPVTIYTFLPCKRARPLVRYNHKRQASVKLVR